MRRSSALPFALLAALLVPAGAARAATGPAFPDFDGDAIGDLAIGVPLEDVGASGNAGAVNVMYGTSTGLLTADSQFFTQSGLSDGVQGGDFFGSALAPGDFDDDGLADLAIGVPGEDVGTQGNAGAVNVLYGSGGGLSTTGAQFFTQLLPGGDAPETGDQFGAAVAAGDFDGDGFADLAIGAPGEDVDGVANAGAVVVLYGSSDGLAMGGNQFWTQNSAGPVLDDAEAGDSFGSALVAADFGGASQADLAIGVPSEDVGAGPILNAGAVNVLYGSAGGLAAAGNQLWHQNSPGPVLNVAEAGDAFGSALAAANFGSGSQADLAIGVPSEDVGAGPILNAGAVNVLYGSAGGLAAAGNQVWHQNSAGPVEDAAEAGDAFGRALAAANLGNSSQADLAIGAPLEDVGAGDAGAVNVLYGSSAGLTASGNQFWHQGTSGVLEDPERGDGFGSALTAANFDDFAPADLSIGIPLEDVTPLSPGAEPIVNCGAGAVLYGGFSGLTASGDQFSSQANPGIASDGAQTGDGFATAVAAID